MNHQLESRMRENRLSGSEGGGAETNRLSLPLSESLVAIVRVKLKLHRLKPDGMCARKARWSER